MYSFPCEIWDSLIGALIGLARSTYGNEHLVTGSTAAAVVECLLAVGTDPNGDTLSVLMNLIDQEKRKLVPGCYCCMAPCGRTNEYDMHLLLNADGEVRRLKLGILSRIQEISALVHRTADPESPDDGTSNYLYKALFAIGMDDWGVEELEPILREAEEIIAACRRTGD